MREYEVTIIVQPNLEEAARNELIERISTWLTHGEGEEAKPVANHWGMRQLAYPIRKFKQGYYVFFEANLDPARVAESERNMRYVEDLLRFLVIRKED
ncbi:MAG: 30S ribosomal protein S6 [Chloroflexi bacterium]|nr:30S ribosomal protein S6 [Ardenticatenaceae bacterium]MBL1127996.1 30S ribosomal protein S6 [Chloroflexota bacterium]NOG34067.1 30S ribosomal protein S6 [Chloroflexota bacterium]GIK54486.1 MAG: 30S ribosomal protein S6 [Chloroflexota bacterium]